MTMRIQIDSGGAADVKADTVVIPITRRGETPTTLPQGLGGLDRRMGGISAEHGKSLFLKATKKNLHTACRRVRQR